jgi:hypothetical protein
VSPLILKIVPLAIGLAAAAPAALEQSVSRLAFQDEVILRVTVQPRPIMPRIRWIEKKGPKCIPVAAIRRAMMSGAEQVDFVLASRARFRAKIDQDCPALDFYGSFYLQPQDDLLCAHRDVIHSRMGGSCEITKFRQLVPDLHR